MKWFQTYKRCVRDNAGVVRIVEDIASKLTWLAPDRFAGSELAIETFHSLLGLLSIWHESIIHDVKGMPWPLWLACVRQMEVLVELRAVQPSSSGAARRNPYTALAAVELLKLLLRLLSWRRATTTLLPLADVHASGAACDGSDAPHHALLAAAMRKFLKQQPLSSQPSQPLLQPPAATSDGENAAAGANMLWWADDGAAVDSTPAGTGAKVTVPETHAMAASVDQKRSMAYKMIVAGEVLHICRPFVYVMLLRRFGRRSWLPWGVSLSIDLLSRQLIRVGADLLTNAVPLPYLKARYGSMRHGGLAALQSLFAFRFTHIEREELEHRDMQMMFYLLRSPVFDNYTRPMMETVLRLLQHVPLVGSLASKAMELLLGIQQYYTYTSAS